LRNEPEALGPWFLTAMAVTARGHASQYRDRLRAVRDSSPFYALYLTL
jgi:hypothetical protein